MQEAAQLVTNLQTESDGVDLVTLLRETPREAYSFQQLGVRPVKHRTPPPAPGTKKMCNCPRAHPTKDIIARHS